MTMDLSTTKSRIAAAAFEEACKAMSDPAMKAKLLNWLGAEVLRLSEDDSAHNLIESAIVPMLRHERTEPLLMFHAYGWQYGGAERLIARIANELDARNYRILIVVFEPITNTSYALNPSVAFLPIRGDSDRMQRLLQFIDIVRPDVFIGHNNSIPELAAIYPVLRQKKVRSIAYILEHYYFPFWHPALYATALARNEAIEQADAACFLTGYSTKAYGAGHQNAALMQGVGSFAIQPPEINRISGKTILAVGRFSDPIKRLDRVLIVFKQVLLRHPDANLFVVGPYNLNAHIPAHSPISIGELLQKLQLPEDQIHFEGEQSRTERYYAEADVFILTSDSEGFPLVLTEAGSYGLPAVIVDIPGLEDIILDGENGYIVPQDNLHLLADRISDLFGEPEKWQRMSRRARELIDRFSLETVGTRWEQLIQLVVNAHSRDELNHGLADRFMPERVNELAVTAGLVREYERLSAKIEELPPRRTAGSQVQHVRNIYRRAAAHWRARGFKSMLRTMKRKLYSEVLRR